MNVMPHLQELVSQPSQEVVAASPGAVGEIEPDADPHSSICLTQL